MHIYISSNHQLNTDACTHMLHQSQSLPPFPSVLLISFSYPSIVAVHQEQPRSRRHRRHHQILLIRPSWMVVEACLTSTALCSSVSMAYVSAFPCGYTAWTFGIIATGVFHAMFSQMMSEAPGGIETLKYSSCLSWCFIWTDTVWVLSEEPLTHEITS